MFLLIFGESYNILRSCVIIVLHNPNVREDSFLIPLSVLHWKEFLRRIRLYPGPDCEFGTMRTVPRAYESPTACENI
jgi:hypothetical protein